MNIELIVLYDEKDKLLVRVIFVKFVNDFDKIGRSGEIEIELFVNTNVFVNNFVNKPPPLPPLRPWQRTLKYLQPLLRRTIKYLQPLLRLKFKVLALADTAMKLMEKDMELLSKLIASKRSSKLIALKQQ